MEKAARAVAAASIEERKREMANMRKKNKSFNDSENELEENSARFKVAKPATLQTTKHQTIKSTTFQPNDYNKMLQEDTTTNKSKEIINFDTSVKVAKPALSEITTNQQLTQKKQPFPSPIAKTNKSLELLKDPLISSNDISEEDIASLKDLNLKESAVASSEDISRQLFEIPPSPAIGIKQPPKEFIERARNYLENRKRKGKDLPKSTPSKTTVDSHTTPSSSNIELTRYKSSRTNSKNVMLKVPNSKTTTICNIIDKFLTYDDINDKDSDEDEFISFLEMKDAKEFFIRKLFVFSKDRSLMQFRFPLAVSKYQPVNYMTNNDIDLSFGDIESLFDEEYLNDDVLSFVMKCINFHNLESSSKAEIPDVLFGSVHDYGNVVPKKGNKQFKDIIEHLEYVDTYGASSDQNFIQSEESCITNMQEWYCGSSKHYLSALLNHYEIKKQIITTYANILHVCNSHWIFLVVKISGNEDNFIPSVFSMDGLCYADNEASYARLWFAKFFGLYVKEFYNTDGLSEEDFNCHDIIDAKNNCAEYIQNNTDKKNISMLKHEVKNQVLCKMMVIIVVSLG